MLCNANTILLHAHSTCNKSILWFFSSFINSSLPFILRNAFLYFTEKKKLVSHRKYFMNISGRSEEKRVRHDDSLDSWHLFKTHSEKFSPQQMLLKEFRTNILAFYPEECFRKLFQEAFSTAKTTFSCFSGDVHADTHNSIIVYHLTFLPSLERNVFLQFSHSYQFVHTWKPSI